MESPCSDNADSAAIGQRVRRVGCVSYLNSKPLIEGLTDLPDPQVRFDVPARLLSDLEAGEVDIALCPVIDYHRATSPLRIVPVGGICSEGKTLTVCLFSQVPIEQITEIHADSDSHTSVALLQVLLNALYNLKPRLIEYHAQQAATSHHPASKPQAMLLIGDKVVTNSPLAVEYPHQLDLGQAWNELTGLPFVFATWLARPDAPLGDLPDMLAQQRAYNATRIDALVERYAQAHGWPAALAGEYMSKILSYKIGPRELEAIERFGSMAAELNLIPQSRPLELWR